MKSLVITSNMYNEIDQIEGWVENVRNFTDEGVIVVDNGSTDGTIQKLRDLGVIVVESDIIVKEGYGPARNHLREMAKKHFPKAHWNLFLDADERLNLNEQHMLRHIKDSLSMNFDVVAFPRIDWKDKEMTEMAKDWHVYPDYQGRMTRLYSPLKYVRKLHEQISGCTAIYAELTTPKINHFHRSATQKKRDQVGRICAKLHYEDLDFGHTYPIHKKEKMYYQQYLKEGL